MNATYTPENNGVVTHADCKTNQTPDKWNGRRNSDKNQTGALLAKFTINNLFLSRQPGHDFSRFAAEIHSRCQVDEQSRFHHSWRIATLSSFHRQTA